MKKNNNEVKISYTFYSKVNQYEIMSTFKISLFSQSWKQRQKKNKTRKIFIFSSTFRHQNYRVLI